MDCPNCTLLQYKNFILQIYSRMWMNYKITENRPQHITHTQTHTHTQWSMYKYRTSLIAKGQIRSVSNIERTHQTIQKIAK